MRILVTGGAGFIGSNLAKHLESPAGGSHVVIVLDNFSSGSFLNLVNFCGDVITGECLAHEPCHSCDVIFHEASITDTTVVDQNLMLRNNLESFRHVLGWAAHWNARVVWASSAATYGNQPAPNKLTDSPNPLNVYGYSKLAMEHLADRWSREHNKLPIVGLRYFNVYGPGEAHKGKFASMIYQLAQQMKSGIAPRIFKHGEQKRDFVSILDVLAANVAAMKASTSGVYNVGCGKANTFNSVIAGLNSALGTSLQAEYIDNPYPFFQNHTEADITATTQALGYKPAFTNIAKGIAAYHETGAL